MTKNDDIFPKKIFFNFFSLDIKLVLKNKIWGSAKKNFCSKGSLDPKRLGTPVLNSMFW